MNTKLDSMLSRGAGRRSILAGAIAGCLASTASVSPAFAQQSAVAEEVVVTGSYLARPADRPQPIQVLDRSDLLGEQRLSVAEIFRDMPSVQGMAVFNNIVETGDSPTSSVNLRGLGTRATLTLLNGRRQTVDADAFTGGGTDAVDINNLVPPIMIERVEVLQDGASALYGSDAIAGVVNFVTRRNFEGMELSLQGQSYDRNDKGNYNFGAIFGAQGERSGVVAGIDVSHRDQLLAEDIYDLDRLMLASTSTFGNPSTFRPVGAPNSANIPDPLCGDPALGGTPQAGLPNFLDAQGNEWCALLLSEKRVTASETDRVTGLATATFDFNSNITAELELGFGRARHKRGTGPGFPIFPPLPVVPATNPGVIAANAADPNFVIQDYQMNHRVGSTIDGGIEDYVKQDSWRAVASLQGTAGAWNWVASAAFSESNTQMKQEDTMRDRLTAALNCTGGISGDLCYNPFANAFLASPGDPEYNDPSIKRWIQGMRIGDGVAKLGVFEVVTTRELGRMAGGATGLAIGIQRREERFAFDWDTISNAGGYAWNNTPVIDFGGTRDSNALFAELVMFPAESFEVQLAARYEDYGSGVDSFDPKLGLLWTPVDGLYVRASAGTSFRVAGVVPTFGQTSTGTGMSLHGQAVEGRGVRIGNPALKPELGETFTTGITWDVTDSFTMDLGYYQIEFTDLIRPEDGQLLLEADIADGTIDNPRIHLDPAAGTNVVANLTATDILGATLTYVNQDFQKTTGLDFRFSWAFSSGASEYDVSLSGTKTLTYDLTTSGVRADAVGSYNNTNFAPPIPDYQADVRFNWQRGAHAAGAVLRHTPKVTEDQVAQQGRTEEFSYTTIDVSYRYTLPRDQGMTLSVGVVNLTDEEDPVYRLALATSFSQLYDPRGRMFNIGLTKSFN